MGDAANNADGGADAVVECGGVRGKGDINMCSEVTEGVENLYCGVRVCPFVLPQLFSARLR